MAALTTRPIAPAALLICLEIVGRVVGVFDLREAMRSVLNSSGVLPMLDVIETPSRISFIRTPFLKWHSFTGQGMD